jgi:hypothetical protein
MRHACLLAALMCLAAVATQGQNADKPCIAFSSGDSTETNNYARDPLATAVTLSGDFRFYPSQHATCWNVHVLSAPLESEGRPLGYAISYTVTDPSGVEVGYGLLIRHDTTVFDIAMRNAAAAAVKDIRLTQSMSQPTTATPPAKK